MSRRAIAETEVTLHSFGPPPIASSDYATPDLNHQRFGSRVSFKGSYRCFKAKTRACLLIGAVPTTLIFFRRNPILGKLNNWDWFDSIGNESSNLVVLESREPHKMVISKKEFSPKEKGICQAITCEGCKGFFRRTEQNHLQYVCKNEERCVITKETRVKCQRCRYLKCLTVMKPDLVMEPEERIAKQQMIKRNRQRRMVEGFLSNPEALGVFPMTEEISSLINKLARQYAENIVPTVDLGEDFQYKDLREQTEALLVKLHERSLKFSEAIQNVGEVRIKRCFARIDVELLEILDRIDIEDRSITKRPTKSASGLVYSTEKVLLDTLGFPVGVINQLLFLAKVFQTLKMDDQQLSLVSAIMLMESDFSTHILKDQKPKMAEVFRFCEALLGQETSEKDEDREIYYKALISYLEYESDRRAVYAFPAIISAVEGLKEFVRNYGDVLVAFPCSLARLLS
ncbi:unnamed protein product [Bursaphelenchus xylophilus]|uniref:(pine wood nematode) hypothetical protein n=1 Tax=Bursaphelenchus xylophilus TaxID=6326 RepID=A0A1I7RLF0_BURXY|nr:unnamed protein product [Bursaphelenchus xylophilus]CAG9083062.1 unnamed protein product [Bursaphelenchus xylophilus]